MARKLKTMKISAMRLPQTSGLSLMREQQRVDQAIGRKIRRLRTKAGVTQRRLAKITGSTTATIACLEDGNYEGNSLAMLKRVAAAFGNQVTLELVPLTKKRKLAGVRVTQGICAFCVVSFTEYFN